MLQADHCQTPINKNMIFYTTAHGNATPEYQNAYIYLGGFVGGRPGEQICPGSTGLKKTLPVRILSVGQQTGTRQGFAKG